MKKFLSLLLSSVMVLALAVAAVPSIENTAKAETLNLLNVSATDLNGNAFSGSVFGQYDLTLVNVWATWCGPCKGEMPYFQQIHTELESRGVNIVGVLFDSESPDYALEIQNENGLTYQTLLPGDSEELKSLCAVISIPVTYFVNRDGDVCPLYTCTGSKSYENWIQTIVSIMYWEYGVEMTDLAPLPSPTSTPFPTPKLTPTPTEGPVADVTYTFDETTGTLTLSGTATDDYRHANQTTDTNPLAPWYDVLDDVKHVVISEGMTYLGKLAFDKLPAIETITWPTTLKYIGENAFYYCPIVNFDVPEGVISMGQQNLQSTTVSLPSTLVEIPNYDYMPLFINATKLTTITVAANNPAFCSVDGVLFTKDKKVLLCYPSIKLGTEYTTPVETTTIGVMAFVQQLRLKSIHLSKNLEMLHPMAFTSMSILRTIYFYSDCPTFVSPKTFTNCSKIETVYYPEGAKGYGERFLGIPTATFQPVTTLLGDVNGDEQITQTDALLVLRTLAGWTTVIDTTAADINGDTQVTQTDALLLLRYLAGWPVAQFPA